MPLTWHARDAFIVIRSQARWQISSKCFSWEKTRLNSEIKRATSIYLNRFWKRNPFNKCTGLMLLFLILFLLESTQIILSLFIIPSFSFAFALWSSTWSNAITRTLCAFASMVKQIHLLFLLNQKCQDVSFNFELYVPARIDQQEIMCACNICQKKRIENDKRRRQHFYIICSWHSSLYHNLTFHLNSSIFIWTLCVYLCVRFQRIPWISLLSCSISISMFSVYICVCILWVFARSFDHLFNPSTIYNLSHLWSFNMDTWMCT